MHDVLDTSERTVIDLPLEVKAGGLPGEFEGYGAVFGNTDRDGDVVAKGAFADSLKARLPALLWQHNAKEPIGRFDAVREDERGLFVKGRLAQSGRGAEAYELLKMGALNGLSIGFVTKEAMRNSAAGTRTIKRADLMEVSLVTFPANELARVQTVKQRNAAMNLTVDTDIETGDINDPRTFERFLREQGFSRNRAKAITAKGFKTGHNAKDQEIHELMVNLLERKSKIETKRGARQRVRLFEGKSKTGFLLGHPSPPSVTFEVIPPFQNAIFDCEIIFYSGKGPTVEPKKVRLNQNRTVDTFRLRREDPVRFDNFVEGLRGLRFDRRVSYTLNYISSARIRGTGAASQDEFIITMR